MNIKKLLSTAISTALVLSTLVIPVSVHAEVKSGNCGANGDNVTWLYDDSTKTLTISGTGAMADYDMDKSKNPPWYHEDWELYTLRGTASVKVEEGVTHIGDYAFGSGVGISSFSIPESLTNIGNYAFYNCNSRSFKYITLPDKVTSIGDFAFQNCTRLEDVVIGNGVTSIGKNAFENCTRVKNITLGNGVTNIGADAFSGCSNAVVSYSGSDKEVAQALDTSGVASVEAAVPSAVITPTYVDSSTGAVPSEGAAAKPAFAADLNDGGATGFVTEFDNSKNKTTTSISSITWAVTSKGVTKSFTSSGTNMQLDAGADAHITFIVKNLYDPDATVVTTIN